MQLTSTLKNHLRVDKPTFQLLQQVSRYSKDLYNKTLYIQRQQFFATGSILSLGKLFKQVKSKQQYRTLPSDIAQQVLILVNQNFRSFFKLLRQKKAGEYTEKVGLPNYLDSDGYHQLVFISRLLKIENGRLRLSLGNRGKQSTGTHYIYTEAPPLGIQPKRIRIIPRYNATYFEINYIYELDTIARQKSATQNSYLSIDLGLDNFATCITTTGTTFIIEGSGIKSFNRWWNKHMAQYMSRINRHGIEGPTRLMAEMQRYSKDVITNFLNHAVRYIIDYCLTHQIETIVVGEWADMKRSLKIRKQSVSYSRQCRTGGSSRNWSSKRTCMRKRSSSKRRVIPPRIVSTVGSGGGRTGYTVGCTGVFAVVWSSMLISMQH